MINVDEKYQNGSKKKVVIAIGGNAILQKDQIGTYEEQRENIKKTAKNITKDTVDAAKAAGKLITYPVKHPVVGLGTVGGVAYASSNRIDKPDKDRMEMSLRSFKNGN